jgi:hypothetical protein
LWEFYKNSINPAEYFVMGIKKKYSITNKKHNKSSLPKYPSAYNKHGAFSMHGHQANGNFNSTYLSFVI